MPAGVRRILIVTSSGGVSLDVIALKPWWRNHHVEWVAVPAPDTRDLLSGQCVTWADELHLEQPAQLTHAVIAALRHMRSSDPDLIVSAGTALAVPYFVAARVLGIPSWWVQTLNVMGEVGLAAKVCSRLANRVLVQRPQLLAEYRRSAYVGELY